MKNERFGKHLLAVFGLALIVYAVVYYAIEHRRARNGPWQVTFTNTAAGLPAIIVNQPKLALTNIQIAFSGAAVVHHPLPPHPTGSRVGGVEGGEGQIMTNAAVTMIFDKPRRVPYDVPFGRCEFMDLISMPGTVTFDLFGHQVQLMPRVLTVDHEEVAWRPGHTMVLSQTNGAAETRK